MRLVAAPVPREFERDRDIFDRRHRRQCGTPGDDADRPPRNRASRSSSIARHPSKQARAARGWSLEPEHRHERALPEPDDRHGERLAFVGAPTPRRISVRARRGQGSADVVRSISGSGIADGAIAARRQWAKVGRDACFLLIAAALTPHRQRHTSRC
jgi:hypothetical protein